MSTMRCVVLTGPREVSVQDRPIPTVRDSGDVIVRVHLAGLCGSELHTYRGDAGPQTGPIVMGHELVGEVVEVGGGVKLWKKGDKVISPFSLSCGSCFYCDRSHTSRCEKQTLLGTPAHDGAQAEYVRISMADASLFRQPEDIPPQLSLLLADVVPTGYSMAHLAHQILNMDKPTKEASGVCVVIGCGPVSLLLLHADLQVGLSAITAAREKFTTVFATDLHSKRLQLATKHGATALPLPELRARLSEHTDGRGADAVLELVGHADALVTATELVRPYGVISSGGVHNQTLDLPGKVMYGKNIRMVFGRCSVRTFLPEATRLLRANLDLFETFVEEIVSVEKAAEYYERFERNKIGKVAFRMTGE